MAAQVDQSHRFDKRVLHKRIEHLDFASPDIGNVAGNQDEPPNAGRRSQGPISLVLVLGAEQARPFRRDRRVYGNEPRAIGGFQCVKFRQL